MCQRENADRLLPEEPSSDELSSTRVGPDGRARDPSRVYVCGRSANRNVAWTWCLTLAMGLADSIWAGTVLVKFLNSLLGNNAYVGYIEAASGAANLVVALPVGWAADRLGKARIARCGGMMIPLALGVTAFAVAYGAAHPPSQDSETMWMLGLFIGAMCLWGTVNAVANGPAQALYADSVSTGERSHAYTVLFVIYLLASVVGPAITILLFESHGEAGRSWELLPLRNIVFAGLGIEIAAMLCLLMLRDKWQLAEESEKESGAERGAVATDVERGTAAMDAVVVARAQVPAANLEGGSAGPAGDLGSMGSACCTGPAGCASDAVLTGPGVSVGIATGAGSSNGAGSAAAPSAAPKPGPAGAGPPSRYTWAVPYVLFASSVCFALGSGMTVKFFPLFFVNDCLMAPAQVQMIYVLVPLVMAAMSTVATKISKRFGRAQVMLVFKLVGIGCLVSMAYLDGWVKAATPGQPQHTLRVVVVAGIYIVRTGLMNCTYPLEESLLMDHVQKSARARWKSLDSISVFGWCGSAALGGYLADRYSYSATFLVTAAIQLVGTLVQIPLLFIARRHEAPDPSPKDAARGGIAPLRPAAAGAEAAAVEGVQ